MVRGIDEQTNALISQLEAERNAGNISDEEYVKQANQAMQDAKNKLYDAQLASIDSEVPL